MWNPSVYCGHWLSHLQKWVQNSEQQYKIHIQRLWGKISTRNQDIEKQYNRTKSRETEKTIKYKRIDMGANYSFSKYLLNSYSILDSNLFPWFAVNHFVLKFFLTLNVFLKSKY